MKPRKGMAMPEVTHPITPKNKTYLVSLYAAAPNFLLPDVKGLTIIEAGVGCQYAALQNVVACEGDIIDAGGGLLFVDEDKVIGLLNLNEIP